MEKKQEKFNQGEIVIYKPAKGEVELKVRLEGETIWLSLNQIASLFNRDKSVISRHLRNIFKEGELTKNSVVAKIATTAALALLIAESDPKEKEVMTRLVKNLIYEN